MKKPWLYIVIVSIILEVSYVKNIKTPRRACMKRLMTVDEVKEACKVWSIWRSFLSDNSARTTA